MMETESNPGEKGSIPRNVAIILIPLVAVIVLALAILLYIALVQNPAAEAVAEIQQALDEQCGPGFIIAGIDGYSTNPEPHWQNAQASCALDSDTGAWVCTCEASP